MNNKSHEWHYRNTYKATKWLGKVACRVTSKHGGIGDAERSWGKVRHNKTDKRAHLSGLNVKMQATLMGNYQAEMAKINQESNEVEDKDKWWDDADFEDLKLTSYGMRKEDLEDINTLVKMGGRGIVVIGILML